jgi:hypothetical protein
MMTTTSPLSARMASAALLLAALTACAGPKVSRSITAAQIGSKYARLTGYFATAKAAPGGRHEEDVSGHLQHDLVLDEATLMSQTSDETCIAVVVRTESQHDEPLAQLSPSCAVAGRGAPAVVEDEMVRVVDHGFQGMAPVVQAEGVAGSAFAALSISAPAEQTFRVVERTARVCCGAGGGGSVSLKLDNARREVADYNFTLTFEWNVR